MGYSEKIKDAQEKAYSQLVATKIIDLMDKLRLNSNKNSSRRWVWELLQNAKDVSHENSKVIAKINLDTTRNLLEFSHNGKPFTSENITFLVEQVSTKSREPDNRNISRTTGKFGTGFLTTHLLSEIVTLNGVLKDSDEPYKKFNITLDRSGRDSLSVIKSVERTLKELNSIDFTPPMQDYSYRDFNTVFRYALDENGILVAKKGIEDLFNSLAFTLVFIPEIEAVIIDNLKIKYELHKTHHSLSENIKLYTVIENSNATKKDHNIIVLKRNNVTIAIEVDISNNRIFFKEFNKLTPKLFCDFPLIGTENFPFPTIVNSPSFNPNEPRDGIYLTDSADKKIVENKSIMLIALDLYNELLHFASQNNWGNMYLSINKINSLPDTDWLSKNWITHEIINPMKAKFSFIPVVDTCSGNRSAIKNKKGEFITWFPSHQNQVIRSKIWNLCSYWIPSMLPIENHVDDWYRVSWSELKNLTLDAISNSIQNMKNIETLKSSLSDVISPIEWLNLYYKLVNDESSFIDGIIGDKYSVLLNQNGVFKKRTELKTDKDIDDELKEVLLILGEDCRSYLLHKDILTGQLIQYYSVDQKSIINKINELLSDMTNKHINDACYYLASLFSDDTCFPKERETIYNFSKLIFPIQVKEKKKISNWSKNIWEIADKRILLNLVTEISSNKNIENLNAKLMLNNESETLQWLNSFVSFLISNGYEHLLNDRRIAILPNQNGNFVIKDDLFLDDGEIDNELKNISSALGHDIREELLSLDIFLELPKNRTKTQEDISEEISSMVKNKLRESEIDDSTKQVFKQLILWFNENEEKAKKYFADLYKNKYKLYDDAEIIENMEKAIKYDELMDKFNIKDYKSLEEILEYNKYSKNENLKAKQKLSEDVLAQLGIFTPEDLEAAFKNTVFADNFIHVSDKESFKFKYVESIINRAIDNVFNHLSSKPDYNLENAEEIAKTIFSVTKNGEDIYIIIRPSDYDQIIIYYDSEKDLLDYEKDCELWVDNDKSTPQKITLGKILKITGINKIPLKRIR